MAGNITPGDTAGFPVTLSQPGSYFLTGPLVMSPSDGAPSTPVVEITTDDVTLDLNGFEIAQWQTCSGSPPTSCTVTGAGVGVRASQRNNITVRNGTVRNTISLAILLGGSCRIENVHIEVTGLFGIGCGDDALLRHVSVERTLVTGISLGPRSSVRDSQASNTGSTGIEAGLGSLLQRNLARANSSAGLRGSNGGSLYVGNAAHGNFTGLLMNIRDGYVDNNAADNSQNAVIGGATQLGANLCNGSLC